MLLISHLSRLHRLRGPKAEVQLVTHSLARYLIRVSYSDKCRRFVRLKLQLGEFNGRNTPSLLAANSSANPNIHERVFLCQPLDQFAPALEPGMNGIRLTRRRAHQSGKPSSLQL